MPLNWPEKELGKEACQVIQYHRRGVQKKKKSPERGEGEERWEDAAKKLSQ